MKHLGERVCRLLLRALRHLRVDAPAEHGIPHSDTGNLAGLRRFSGPFSLLGMDCLLTKHMGYRKVDSTVDR